MGKYALAAKTDPRETPFLYILMITDGILDLRYTIIVEILHFDGDAYCPKLFVKVFKKSKKINKTYPSRSKYYFV